MFYLIHFVDYISVLADNMIWLITSDPSYTFLFKPKIFILSANMIMFLFETLGYHE